MTFQELLKQQGYNDEQIATLSAGMKENKIFLAGEENLDIRYSKLKADYDGLNKQHTDAQTLIEQMKQETAGNVELQAKITNYETERAALLQENERLKVESALKVGLLEAGVNDIDYVTFKLKEKGELSLDENGKIKDWDNKLAGLKTQLPNQFKTSETKKVIENKLPDGEGERSTVTKEQFDNMSYKQRVKLFEEQPEVYKELKK